MIHIIISVDPSTKFLYQIVEILSSKGVKHNLIQIEPTEESYKQSFEIISNLDKESTILFLGHGQSNQLYGGEDIPTFSKKPFVKLNEMGVFKEQLLFLLACDSSDLLKSSCRISKIKKSIGFGGLPTSPEEIEKDRKLALQNISNDCIDRFRQTIVETVSNAFLAYIKRGNNDFIYLKNILTLLIDKKINESIIIERNCALAELLFRMRNDMTLF